MSKSPQFISVWTTWGWNRASIVTWQGANGAWNLLVLRDICPSQNGSRLYVNFGALYAVVIVGIFMILGVWLFVMPFTRKKERPPRRCAQESWVIENYSISPLLCACKGDSLGHTARWLCCTKSHFQWIVDKGMLWWYTKQVYTHSMSWNHHLLPFSAKHVCAYEKEEKSRKSTSTPFERNWWILIYCIFEGFWSGKNGWKFWGKYLCAKCQLRCKSF